MFGFSHRKRQRRLPAVQRMGGRKNTMPGRIRMSSHKNPRPADAAQLVTCTTRQVGFLFGMSALPTSVYTREACCSMPKLSEIPY